ncbi:molybdenum cofactor synthesis domain protein [Thermoproteus uzoniensis 768-20]|uniref:Molybdenum cofactor synthesis domain protein n=1 Tax=Thermoproteus uzoniensis (strain 768-20) TaxID=999630 RepID=F2L523_THEU7|nr:gephyrin-like molybdotransferase Glp [Thermoproteus uzoniensis]AEA12272.1 molybdenum cofactor synthesis domain protein [Thermoproteus uzoniensis 768-20]
MSRGFKSLTPADKAVAEFLSKLSHKPPVVEVPLGEALGRYLARDIIADVDVPPFDRAAFDGYAVRSIDTLGATRTNPVVLKVVGRAGPGRPFEGVVREGEAVEIATGAPLPEGADAVVPYEEAAERGGAVEIYRPVPRYYYVSRRGEDLSKGELVLKAGTRLRPWDLGVLASLGMSRVPIYLVRAAVISTGDELVEVEEVSGGAPPPGKVVNSTRFALIGLFREAGADAEYLGLVPDDEEAIRRALERALSGFDIVATTGGASVGGPDATHKAVSSIADFYVRGIAVRPGRPNGAAVVGGKPVIVLSGFPVAAVVGFEIFARPAILKMVGGRPEPQPTVRGVLTRRITTPINVRTYARVRAYVKEGKVYVEPLAVTGSGVLSTLTRGNAILVVPENREGYDEGEEVEVQLIRELEAV